MLTLDGLNRKVIMYTKEQIAEIFNKYEAEKFLFRRVENKYSKRIDVNAFILLDKLFPNSTVRLVFSTDDSQGSCLALNLPAEEILTLTEENILTLIRCGVDYDKDFEELSMTIPFDDWGV